MSLEPGSLYIILFTRFGSSGSWHWGLYHHITNAGKNGSGWKYHIRNISDGWMTDHASTAGALTSMSLVGLIRIAKNIPEGHNDTIKSILYGIPHNVPNMTCRIWSLAGVQALINAGYVRCNNINALEAEAKNFASRHEATAELAVKPRPIEDSTLCGL